MAVRYLGNVLGTSSAGSTSAAVNLAGKAFVGQLCIIEISRANNNAPTTVPTGWTLLDEIDSTYRTFLYWKVLQVGDLTTLTWSGYAASVRTLISAHLFGGVDTANPIAGYTHGTTTFNTTAASTIDFGSLNTSAPFIAGFASHYNTTVRTVSTQPSGMTERYDYSNATPDMGHYCGTQTWAGGTYAPSAATAYLSDTATYRVGFIVGLNAGNSADIDLDQTVDIYSGAATTNRGTGTSAYVGDPATGAKCRTLVKASALTDVPAGMTVTVAEIRGYTMGIGAGGAADRVVRAHRVLRNWGETTVTYNTYDGTNGWTTVGADGDDTDRVGTESGMGTWPNTIATWKVVNGSTLASDVQSMRAGSLNNYGWLLEAVGMEGSAGDYSRFYTDDEATNVLFKPYLHVEWASGGTTPVSKTLTPQYDIRGLASDTLTPTYDVRTKQNKTLTPVYDILASNVVVSKTLTPQYNIQSLVAKTLTPLYGIMIPPWVSQLTNLPPGTTIYYSAYATNASGTGYGTVLQFTTLGGLTAVSKMLSPVYDMRQLATKTTDRTNMITWADLNDGNADGMADGVVLGSGWLQGVMTGSMMAGWGVDDKAQRIQYTALPGDSNVLYGVGMYARVLANFVAGRTYTLQYKYSGSGSAGVHGSFCLAMDAGTSPVDYNYALDGAQHTMVKTWTADATCSGAWLYIEAPGVTYPGFFDFSFCDVMIEEAGSALPWIAGSKGIQYNIRQLANKTLIPSYNMRSLVNKPLKPSYDMRQLSKKDLTPSYSMRSLSGKTLTPLYSLFNKQTKTLSLTYNIRELVRANLIPSYYLTSNVSQHMTITYAVLKVKGMRGYRIVSVTIGGTDITRDILESSNVKIGGPKVCQ